MLSSEHHQSEPKQMKNNDFSATDGREVRLWSLSIGVLSVVLAFVSFQAAMRNYFTGDDFVYLNWLRLAAAEPSRLWNVFWSNSLDAQSTKFYRPLLSLSMKLDEQLWGRNAFGFHLTNLLFHTACSVLIYFITRDVLIPKKCSGVLKLWPVFAAGLFLLYPLHPEVVTWIGGRVDCVATSFVLGCFYAYTRWRDRESKAWLWCSSTCFVLALCSKEFAIVLPALLMVYEYFLKQPLGSDETQRSSSNYFKAALKVLSLTTPFWLILVLYFVVRRITLGTFVGGYDDRLAIDFDYARLLQNWLNSVSMLFVPINLTLLTARSSNLELAWIGAIAASLFSLIKLDLTSRSLRPALNFLVCSLILFLLPVYKLLAIAGDLQSSRLGHLATVPVCCLLALGVCSLAGLRNHLRAAAVTIVLFLSMTAFWLHVNNKAWANAGTASNNIQHVFSTLEKQGVKSCIVFGAPDSRNGAYICRNAFHEMHSLNLHVLSMPSPLVSQSVGALKDGLVRRPGDAIYMWDDKLLSIVKCEPVSSAISEPVAYSGSQLEKLFPKENKNRFDSNGLKMDDGQVKDIQLDRNPSSFDVLVLEVMPSKKFSPSSTYIIFNNNFSGQQAVRGQSLKPDTPMFNSAMLDSAMLNAPTTDSPAAGLKERPVSTQPVHIVFPLRGVPGWQLDSSEHSRLLWVPNTKNIDYIRSIVLVPISSFAPAFTSDRYDIFGPQENDHLPGEFRLDSARKTRTFQFDATKIKAASGVMVELSKPYSPFQSANPVSPDKGESFRSIRINSTSGHFDLSCNDFPKPATYFVRIWAIDVNGRPIGLSSDTFTLNIR